MTPEKNSPLAKAKTYLTNLENSYVDLDNNEAESQTKKFDRNNFMFCKSEKGEATACILLTTIDLGYDNSFERKSYLEYFLNNIDKLDFQNLSWTGPIPKEIRI